MESTPDPEAVKATSQLIVNDSPRALNPIPTDEVIVDPNATDYIVPGYLQKTTTRAPDLASEFAELLVMLRDLNSRFVGERTVDAQAILSLTGEHEVLEFRFLDWCRRYFGIRGSLDRLNPGNDNDPWKLYTDCCDEFCNLIVARIVQPGTINSSVLNLSQRFMRTCFAEQVLKSDVKNLTVVCRDRFGNSSSRINAHQLVAAYRHEVQEFTKFLGSVEKGLPPSYLPDDGFDWLEGVQSKIQICADDMRYFRNIGSVLDVSDSAKHQLVPGLWARLSWDVYHGGSIMAVLTFTSSEPSSQRSTRNQLSFGRDGWLCHREYPWLRVPPEYPSDKWRAEIAVSWYVLDTLTVPWYEAWLEIDPISVIARGREPDATEAEVDAGIAMAMGEPEQADEEQSEAVEKKRLVPRLKLSKFENITKKYFQCTWSQGKGSERKVYREGCGYVVFGRHGKDRQVSSIQLKNCLKALGIPVRDFLDVCP